MKTDPRAHSAQIQANLSELLLHCVTKENPNEIAAAIMLHVHDLVSQVVEEHTGLPHAHIDPDADQDWEICDPPPTVQEYAAALVGLILRGGPVTQEGIEDAIREALRAYGVKPREASDE